MKFKMRELLQFKGRSVKPRFLKWAERRRQGAFLRYYLKPREDTRSVFGKRLDTVVGTCLVWLASFLLLVNFTGRPLAALVLSLPLLPAEALLLKKFRAARERRRQFQQRLWSAGQKLTEELQRMDPRKEFLPYVRDTLGGLPGFEGMTLSSGKKDIKKEEQGIDLEGAYKGIPLAVRCINTAGEQKVTPEDVRAFAGALRQEGYQNGLLVTSGDFGSGILPVLKEAARGGIRIKLVNRYRLMDLARQAGSGPFREEVAPPKTPSRFTGESRSRALAAFRDSALGSRKKAKSYFLYGMLLYGGYFLLKESTLLSLVYLFFASLNLILGAACIFFGKTIEEMDPLEGLESEK